MLMETLFQLYMKRRIKKKGDYGIEIETECGGEYLVPEFVHWMTHGDGSLRNFGIEYISNGPLVYGDHLEKALAEFETKTKDIRFQQSVYSSLHVHVNMTNFQIKEFPVFMSLLYLMENVLVRYCGPDRDGNLFCLKTSQAEAGLDSLIQIFNQFDTHNLRNIARQMSMVKAVRQKYSAINYASLAQLGSVEMRMHGGTTNMKEVKEWIDTIHKIKLAVPNFGTPNSVITHLHEVGAIGFVRDVFGKDISKKLITRRTEEDVNDNLFYLLRIAKAANWAEFDQSKLTDTLDPKSARPKYNLEDDFPDDEEGQNPRWIPTRGGAGATLTQADLNTLRAGREHLNRPVPPPAPARGGLGYRARPGLRLAGTWQTNDTTNPRETWTTVTTEAAPAEVTVADEPLDDNF